MAQPRRPPTVWDAPPQAPLVDPNSFIGKKPSRTIPVPPEYRRQTLARERDTLVNDILVEANCHVVPHWDQGKIKSFDIHGTGHDLEKAVTRINLWIANAHIKSKESSVWAKLPAHDPNKWYYDRVEEKEHESKQRYKGSIPLPDDPDAPKHAIVLDWPAVLSDEQLSPRDVWGNKLEHLDQLRMQDNVWITLLGLQSSEDKKWQIEIVGHDLSDVVAASEHLNTLLAQVQADASGIQHAHNIILDEREGIMVQLQRDEDWWPNHADTVVPRLLPDEVMDEPGNFRQEVLHSTQVDSIRTAIESSLERIRSRKGAYDFAVRLGCIALKSRHTSNDKLGQRFTKKTFLKDINGPVELDVKKWLVNDEDGYHIFHRLTTQADFLETTKSAGYFGCMPATLKETRPTFRGTWVFRDANNAVTRPPAPPRHPGRPVPLNPVQPNMKDVPQTPTSLFVILVDWTDDEGGQYEKGTPRFYKLRPGKKGPTKNMDVNLLELGESRGWQFSLESLIHVPSKVVPPFLKGFAEQVKMKSRYKVPSTEHFADWETTPTVKGHLLTHRLDSIYRFGIKDTCYKVELTAMWYPAQKLPVWGLAVRHIEWEIHLAELESLPIGRRAEWEDTMATFFPKDGQSSRNDDDEDLGMEKLDLDNNHVAPAQDGLAFLFEKILKLSALVSSVTNEGGVRL